MACQHVRPLLRSSLSWQPQAYLRLQARSLNKMSERHARRSPPSWARPETRRPEPEHPAHNAHHTAHVQPARNMLINRTFTRACMVIAGGICVAFNFAEGGLSYKMYDKFQREQGPTIKRLTGLSLPAAPNTAKMQSFMDNSFTMSSGDSLTSMTWLPASLSHRDPVHAFFTFYTWYSFMGMLGALPPVHYASLVFGGACVSGISWIIANRGKDKKPRAMGSSGIVSGLLVTATCFAPLTPVRVFFILPMPLIILTGGFFAVDTYLSSTRDSEEVAGHVAHVSGGLFGLLYYAVFLRRYGGFLHVH